MDDLDVGDVVAVVTVAVAVASALDRVEGVADGPVADGVHVHLEAEPVQLG